MKEIIYDTYSQKPVVRDYEGEPKLEYRECESGLSLRVVVRDEDAEKVLEALKGSLPDDVLNALGIEATGEDLEELCEELRGLGYQCSIKSFEREGEYCEEIEIELTQREKYVVVSVSGKRVKREKSKETVKFLELTVEGREVVRLRASLEEESFREVKASKEPIREVLKLYGIEIDPGNFDFSEFVSRVDNEYSSYYLETEREGESYEIYLET